MTQENVQKDLIFISYNRIDLEQVKTLTQDFEELRYAVWIDQAISGGQIWWDHILDSIRECEIFVFALTRGSLESQACMQELSYARELKKPVLPILLSDEVSTSHLPSILNEIQYVDYRRQDKDAFKRLVKAIKNLPHPSPLPDPLPKAPLVPLSYLSRLKEQIESVKCLSFEEQAAIVLTIKKHLAEESRHPEELQELHNLLHLLRQRDDSLTRTADEIDILLSDLEKKENLAPQVKKEKPSNQASTRIEEPLSKNQSEQMNENSMERSGPLGTQNRDIFHYPSTNPRPSWRKWLIVVALLLMLGSLMIGLFYDEYLQNDVAGSIPPYTIRFSATSHCVRTGITGFAFNMATQQEAVDMAISDCIARGGIPDCCASNVNVQ